MLVFEGFEGSKQGSRTNRKYSRNKLGYDIMKRKAPCSIITDGDLAMRNAITRVMLGVFHRLCA